MLPARFAFIASMTPVAWLAKAIAELGVAEGSTVRVSSEHGELEASVELDAALLPGVVSLLKKTEIVAAGGYRTGRAADMLDLLLTAYEARKQKDEVREHEETRRVLFLPEVIARIPPADSLDNAMAARAMFEAGEFDVCQLVFARFKSAISQIVTVQQLTGQSNAEIARLQERLRNALTAILCVAGIGIVQAATLYEPAFAVVARRSGPFQSFVDFARRTRLSRAELERLAEADAGTRINGCCDAGSRSHGVGKAASLHLCKAALLPGRGFSYSGVMLPATYILCRDLAGRSGRRRLFC